MNGQSQGQLEGTLQALSEELLRLKGQIERQASSFEEVLAQLSSLDDPGVLLRSRQTAYRIKPQGFVASATPDATMLRQVIRQRKRRANLFPGIEFSDPAWEMLLDLKAAKGERRNVSVSSLCIASGVAPTTALRWIGHMIEAGLVVRHEDEEDRRRVYISLTDYAAAAMARYFSEAKREIELFA